MLVPNEKIIGQVHFANQMPTSLRPGLPPATRTFFTGNGTSGRRRMNHGGKFVASIRSRSPRRFCKVCNFIILNSIRLTTMNFEKDGLSSRAEMAQARLQSAGKCGMNHFVQRLNLIGGGFR
jgi:hypothetical protein